MTKLKDVAHLYLGCECKLTKPSYWTVHELHLSVKENFILTPKLYDHFFTKETRATIKPLLRPFSSMTDEEGKQIFSERMGDDSSFTPDEFLKLLKYHFDLFGLIDSGEAIDATKEGI